jgi:hypothetical protein
MPGKQADSFHAAKRAKDGGVSLNDLCLDANLRFNTYLVK